MLLVLRVLVYETALALLLVLFPLWVALGPGTVVGIFAEMLQGPGLLLALAGTGLWLWATVVLVARGEGTPLPLDPPRRLVVEGPYAWMRNPMHVGLVAILVGVAFLFRSPAYLLYAILIGGLAWAYWRWVEDPSLERRYGDPYKVYRALTPAWYPRRPEERRPSPGRDHDVQFPRVPG